jgi:hypothetical protein
MKEGDRSSVSNLSVAVDSLEHKGCCPDKSFVANLWENLFKKAKMRLKIRLGTIYEE